MANTVKNLPEINVSVGLGNVDVNLQSLVDMLGTDIVTTVRRTYTVPVDTVNWTELIASTPADITAVEIFDSSGQTLELGVGPAAGEVRKFLVFPGGNGKVRPVEIPSGSRIAIRAISADADAGEFTANFMG